MQIDLPATVLATLCGICLSGMVAFFIRYGKYESFKKDTENDIRELRGKYEALHTKVDELKILLTEIRQNQINHDAKDTEAFTRVLKSLETMDKNFKEIWQKATKD